MSGILDIDFTLEKGVARLGYYYNEAGVKGHSFHYTNLWKKLYQKDMKYCLKL